MEITTLSEINGITATSGRITGTRHPALRSSKIISKNGRALSGGWSHVRRALANDQLYGDRILAFTEWFDVWDSSQRCKFFLKFLRKCTPNELMYIEGWFIQRSPILRQDFTSALPKWISLYIFSHLDPKSLCQASQVSWHWHFLAEQDTIWMPKCVRLGWLLPVFPNKKEYGAWKYHYINCVNSLDFKVSSYQVSSYAKQRSVMIQDNITIKCEDQQSEIEDELPLDQTDSLIKHEQPRPQWQLTTKSPRLLEKDTLTTLQKHPTKKIKEIDINGNMLNHKRSKSVPATLSSTKLNKSRRSLSRGDSGAHADPSFHKGISLQDRSFADLTKLSVKTSSFENFTLERKLKKNSSSVLNTSRSFESKAFNVSQLDDSKRRNDFVEEQPVILFISSNMPAKEILLDSARYGVITIPYDYEGTTLDDLLMKLKMKLSGRLSRCIGFCVDGDKVTGTAKLIEGATLSVSSLQNAKMQEFWKQVCTHVADNEDAFVDFFWPIAATENGLDILDDLTKLTGVKFSSPIGFCGSLTRMETEWLKESNKSRTPDRYFKKDRIMSWINYSEYLEETLQTLREALKNYLQQEFSGLVDHIIGSLAGKLLKIADINEVERLCSSVSSICASGFHESSDDEMTERLRKLTKLLNGKAVDEDRGELEETADISSIPRDSSDLQIEQRTRSAYTVFELEAEYKDKLNVLMNIYMKPLSSSIQSNRAIISNSSVKMIFNDCETLEKISSELVIDLKKRIDSWNSEQCLGDVYLKFSTNLKAYSNFLKHYPTILRTLEGCIEENPSFRAFLEQQRRNCRSRLLRRAGSLSALMKCTPSEHKDRQYIAKSLRKLKEIADSFKQVSTILTKPKYQSK
eukprot:Seg1418.2 transcript_id=Seg1418.2/GoldUCD/mRNA.D3Y31 product="Epithelial cell-transforming sequence 2 oncogene-like" protein_id=Seg1418.2/GoldUCD/D3Y31